MSIGKMIAVCVWGGYLWVCNNVMRFSFLYIAASYTHVHSFSCILLVAIYITFLNILPKMFLSLKVENGRIL